MMHKPCDVNQVFFYYTALQIPFNLGKRKVGSGGLASLVGTLGTGKKAKKQSVLDKSAQDWRQFVEQEDLEEELSSHMRSRESYLDKQVFCEEKKLIK